VLALPKLGPQHVTSTCLVLSITVFVSAGADRAQSKTVADTKRPIPIPTEQEAVAPEAFPNPSEVRNPKWLCLVH
jgi:hypothetical protein